MRDRRVRCPKEITLELFGILLLDYLVFQFIDNSDK